MELLAPAGNFENFHAALEAGADAVYVGAPGLNARNPSRELTLDQIGSMITAAHNQGRKIYIALNSLVKEQDMPKLLDTLAYFEMITPDGLIIQDLGIVNLVIDHFPSLEIHGSTLMAVHNRAGVQTLSSLGFTRVVIAREYTIKEIARLTRESAMEIEVFVHGAMCFSYSGLCMFSSYLGGKSGLRGNCVQPCRRKYTTVSRKRGAGKTKSSGGYLFSMNDLSGLEMVPDFMRIGVSSLKIEGRLRSATYVKNIVSAYRMMIDMGGEFDPQVFEKAASLVPEAMGRKTSSGYFQTPQPKDAIVQFQSGNIGSHLGRISGLEKSGNETFFSLKSKKIFKVGDRIRLHFEKGDKRESFTVATLKDHDKIVESASKNKNIRVLVPLGIDIQAFKGIVNAYLVDVKKVDDQAGKMNHNYRPLALSREQNNSVREKVRQISRYVTPREHIAKNDIGKQPVHSRTKNQTKSELWLRVDSARLILGRQLFVPDRYLINIDRKSMSSAGEIKRFLGRNMRSVIWALPPVLNDSPFQQMRKSISILIKSGFKTFQVAHLSQIELFEGEHVQLFGDYSLNIMNNQAMRLLAKLDFRGFQTSIELNRDALKLAIQGFRSRSGHSKSTSSGGIQVGATVYGAPPLFISRLASKDIPYGKTIISPKNEKFYVEKKDGHTLTRPQKPFSLLPFRTELEKMGINYFVVDVCGMHPGKKGLVELQERINRKGSFPKLPTFNYLGSLE